MCLGTDIVDDHATDVLKLTPAFSRQQTSVLCKRFEFGGNREMMYQIVHFGCTLDCSDSVASQKSFAASIGAT